MARLGQKIHTNPWDYEVYAVPMRDINTTRYSVDIYVVAPDGSISDLFTVSRKDYYTGKKPLDFIFDLDGDFDRDDIDKIRYELKSYFHGVGNKDVETIQAKATIQEIQQKISEYIRINAEELEDNISAEVFIRGDYGYILTTKMKEFVNEYKDGLGYKKIEILKRLKVMGVLVTTKDRPYDTLVSVDGVKRRYYKIKLADEQEEETAGEVIDIGHKGV